MAHLTSGPAFIAPNQGPAAPLPNPIAPAVQMFWTNKTNLENQMPSFRLQTRIRDVIHARVIEKFQRVVPATQRAGVPTGLLGVTEAITIFTLLDQHVPMWTNRFLGQSFLYLVAVARSTLDASAMHALIEDWNVEDSAFATTLAVASPFLIVEGLAVVGFTTAGVAAGSVAALWQSTIGNVAAGSLFSAFQSVGAIGALAAPAAAGIAVVAGASYGVYKLATRPTAEDRLAALLDRVLDDREKREAFWGVIDV